MTADDIPELIKSFIATHIQSVEQLEILLLLTENAERDWSAAEVSNSLVIHLESAFVRLKELSGKGLLVSTPEPDPRYRFQPSTPEVAKLLHDLADVYKRRRVSVITLIFSKPLDNIRSFADAFKLRKDEE
ncbi:MAG: hypothetical protein H0T73_15365 [Ardenticatenales bacterium]|nr:hypothetical protein [Ardenticatenales bacterium]